MWGGRRGDRPPSCHRQIAWADDESGHTFNTDGFVPDPQRYGCSQSEACTDGAYGWLAPTSSVTCAAMDSHVDISMDEGATWKVIRKTVARSLSACWDRRRHFISFTSTAFCACSRFSASSKISSAWASITSVVISSPRWAGRQCSTMAPGLAASITASFT